MHTRFRFMFSATCTALRATLSFTQKSPSQRILRMREFFADFNFEVVQFVRGTYAAVPDFLSRGRSIFVFSMFSAATCTALRATLSWR